MKTTRQLLLGFLSTPYKDLVTCERWLKYYLQPRSFEGRETQHHPVLSYRDQKKLLQTVRNQNFVEENKRNPN
jgi:hypothetical protein